ncbi:MAG: 2TM domain-containing protein [Flavobacteriaceae bacterium]
MELIEDNKDRKRRRKARKKVEELKGFYKHLTAYLMVNVALSVFKIMGNLNNGESFGDAFFDFGTFAVWFFWGIGLFFHGLKVFSVNPLFSKDWEEKQIQKYIEEEKEAAAKYR